MINTQRLMLYCEGYVWSRHRSWQPVETIMWPELWTRDTEGMDQAMLDIDRKISFLPKELDKKKNLKMRLLTVTLGFNEMSNVPPTEKFPQGGLIDVPKGGVRV